jgi:hypothetical protein
MQEFGIGSYRPTALRVITSDFNRAEESRVFFLILLSFYWLAAFHMKLLQAILFVTVYVSVPLFLATCFKIVVAVFLLPFSGYCSFKDVDYKLVISNYMPYS